MNITFANPIPSLHGLVQDAIDSLLKIEVALKEHEAILHALEARDPLAAEAAMRTHLKASEHRWVGG